MRPGYWIGVDWKKVFFFTGCLNGGGQIKPKPGQSAKELIQLLEIVYMDDVSFLSTSQCINSCTLALFLCNVFWPILFLCKLVKLKVCGFVMEGSI